MIDLWFMSISCKLAGILNVINVEVTDFACKLGSILVIQNHNAEQRYSFKKGN